MHFPKAQAVAGMLRKSKHHNSVFFHISFSTNFKTWFSKNWISYLDKARIYFMFKKLRIFFWLGSKDRKEENTRKSQKLIFFSGQEKKLLCCTKERCSNFLGNLGLKHPSKHMHFSKHEGREQRSMKDRIYENYMKESGLEWSLTRFNFSALLIVSGRMECGREKNGKWFMFPTLLHNLLCPSPGSTHFSTWKKQKQLELFGNY